MYLQILTRSLIFAGSGLNGGLEGVRSSLPARVEDWNTPQPPASLSITPLAQTEGRGMGFVSEAGNPAIPRGDPWEP